MTERGLAKRVGISQAHMHNVLKGARILTPELADRLLHEVRLSVLDLAGDLAPRKGPQSADPPRTPAVAGDRAASD